MVQNRVFVSMSSGAMFMMSAISIFSLTSYWIFFFNTEGLFLFFDYKNSLLAPS